jgi:hypothetical protein
MIISPRFRAALAVVFLFVGATLAHAQTVKTWLMLNEVSQETCFVADPAEHARLTNAGWRVNGTGGLLITAQPNTVGMQRWTKGFDKGNDRIFATSPEQAAAAKKAGYNNEGTMGQVGATQLTPKMIPVYQFTRGEHNLWLINKVDQAWAEKNGWKLKGPAFWIWPKTGA